MTLASHEDITNWLEQLRSDEPISSDDDRYVNLTCRAGEGAANKGNWLTPLLNVIQYSNRPTCQFFSGYIGTGKSTTLLELKKTLEAAGYIILHADAADYHDLSHAIRIEEMLIMNAAAIGEQAEKLLGRSLMKQSFYDRLATFLKTELRIDSVRIPTGAGNMNMALKNNKNHFWQSIMDVLSGHVRSLKDQSRKFIEECLREIEIARRPKGIVFILDSLEKLNGNFDNFNQVMESLVDLLTRNHDVLKPPCHTIYTLPPYINLFQHRISSLYDSRELAPLPAIKVLNQDRTDHIPGLLTLAKVIDKRVPLKVLFGVDLDAHFPEEDWSKQDTVPKTVLESEGFKNLRNIIVHSGGHIRLLLSMTRDLLFETIDAALPATNKATEIIIRTYQNNAEWRIRKEAVPILGYIMEHQSLLNIGGEDRQTLAQYMNGFSVLSYQNGHSWVDVHPIIYDYIKEAVKKLSESEEA